MLIPSSLLTYAKSSRALNKLYRTELFLSITHLNRVNVHRVVSLASVYTAASHRVPRGTLRLLTWVPSHRRLQPINNSIITCFNATVHRPPISPSREHSCHLVTHQNGLQCSQYSFKLTKLANFCTNLLVWNILPHTTVSDYKAWQCWEWRQLGNITLTKQQQTVVKKVKNWLLYSSSIRLQWPKCNSYTANIFHYHYCKQPHLSAIVQAQRFSLFGHSVWMPDETDSRKIVTASPLDNWKTTK